AMDRTAVHNLANRILRMNGKMILFSQEPYTTELIKNDISNLPFSYRMIWEKDHFANALLANKAPVSYYEDILVFSKLHDHEALHPLWQYFAMIIDYIGLSMNVVIDRIGQKEYQSFRTSINKLCL